MSFSKWNAYAAVGAGGGTGSAAVASAERADRIRIGRQNRMWRLRWGVTGERPISGRPFEARPGSPVTVRRDQGRIGCTTFPAMGQRFTWVLGGGVWGV